MKRSFTIVELLISVTLFSIITLFLYKTLDITKQNDMFFTKKLTILDDDNKTKQLILSDFTNAISKAKVFKDNNQNHIISINSKNTQHNPYYTHITYFLTKKDNLARVESYEPFDPKKLNYDYFEKSFNDIVLKKIEKFQIIQSTKDKSVYMIYFLSKDRNEIILNIKLPT